ncbi:MAG TPA: hypothetical protein VMV69_10955 [Pirellulales bacterium]|nr:hypothetical protein [Pirellulales bacterium]
MSEVNEAAIEGWATAESVCYKAAVLTATGMTSLHSRSPWVGRWRRWIGAWGRSEPVTDDPAA